MSLQQHQNESRDFEEGLRARVAFDAPTSPITLVYSHCSGSLSFTLTATSPEQLFEDCQRKLPLTREEIAVMMGGKTLSWGHDPETGHKREFAYIEQG